MHFSLKKTISPCLHFFAFFILFILVTSSTQAQNKKKADSLLNVLKTTTFDTTKINTLASLSYIYISSDTIKALQLANEGLQMAKKINYKKGLAKNYFSLGLIYRTNGNFTKSIYSFNDAFSTYSEINDKKEMVKCYNQIGSVHGDKGNYSVAVECFEKALIMSKESKDKFWEAKCNNSIGNVYKDQGKYNDAIEKFLKALRLYEEIQDMKGIASANLSIGIIQNKQNNNEKAIEYFQKVLDISKKINDKKGILACYNNFGIVFNKQGNTIKRSKDSVKAPAYFNKAVASYLSALTILEELGNKKGIAICYNNIGTNYIDLKDYKKAIEYSQKALKKFEELGALDEVSIVLANLANLENEQKNYASAITHAEQSLKIATQIGSIENKRFAHEKLYVSYKGMGKLKEALVNYEQYTKYNDLIFEKEKNKQFLEMNTKYETEKKQKEIALLNKDKQLQTVEIKQQQTKIYAFIGGLALMVFLAFVLLRSYRIKRKANILLSQQNEEIRQQSEEIMAQRDEITEQRDQITEINTSLIDSIRYAERIQKAVLPSSELFNVLLDDYFVLFKPKDIVSGDFYYVAKRGNWVLFAVADCTGHGVPGAFMCMLGVSFINEIVARVDVQTAGHLLNELRDSVIHSLKQKGVMGEQKDGMDITFCALNTETLEIHYAGANNPLYIVTNKTIEDTGFQTYLPHETSDLQLVEYKPSKMPIGIYEKMDPFTNHTFQLHKGDVLYLMSDGYEDQFGGPKGRKFLSKNLKKLLLATADKPLDKQKQILDTAIEDWKNACDIHHEQIDDITIMGIRI